VLTSGGGPGAGDVGGGGEDTLPATVTESCPARVGLMGNPSDGFHGKTLR
jgi:hypothetical protein